MTEHQKTIVVGDLFSMSQTALPWQLLEGKTVLVTGATGMLASYVTWLLLFLHERKGINVTVVALCRNRGKALDFFGEHTGKPYFHLLIQDVCDPIAYHGPVHFVFHLAGNASPHFINTDPVGILRCNLLGTMNLLEWARKAQSSRVILASTREVYGKSEGRALLDESAYGTLDPLDYRSCYPESKRAAEALLKAYHLQYGIPFNSVRIAHSYGPAMLLKNDGRVMADLLGDVVAGHDIVLKSNGEAVRAFIYVADAVTAMFTVLFRANQAETYNLANEAEPISIKDLARLLTQLRKDKTLKVVCHASQETAKGYCDYRRVALDTSKLQALGWKPTVSLREGISRTFQFNS